MQGEHYHLIYFAGTTPYATLKLRRGDAIETVSKYLTNIYGNVFDGKFDDTMHSRLQMKIASMELDNLLLMERDDPLTVGIRSCSEPNCLDGPVMS